MTTVGDGVETYTDDSVYAAVLAGESWADREMDPTRIDWAARQAEVGPLVPIDLVNGRPYHAEAHRLSGIRYGRGRLGHWGPQLCADVAATLTDPDGHRQILLIERRGGDGTEGWALPGGYVERGESVFRGAVRELWEETGLTLTEAAWLINLPRYVPDPRQTAESWMVTTVCEASLGPVKEFPAVQGSDDAKRAAWVWADSYDGLQRDLMLTYGGIVFEAHRELLRDLLDGHTSKPS